MDRFKIERMAMTKKTNLFDINTQYGENADGVFRKHTQEIPSWHLDSLKDQRYEMTNKREGEFMRVASIPTSVVEQWIRQGYNIYEMSGKEIIKKLKADNLDAFLTTNKQLN